jgi:hypothetical protein
LLEGSAEIVRTGADQPGERCERYLLGEMFLDVGGGDALLPGREATLRRSFDALRPGI